VAAAQPNALKTLRVPLVGTFLNRNGQANTDQRFINCYPESVKAPINNQQKIYLVQRPGFTSIATIDTTRPARGLKYWNGFFYTVYGNRIYKTTTGGVSTQIGSNLTTSTGECAFEIATVPEGNVLVLADGDYVYVIEADNTVTQVPLVLNNWVTGTAYAAGARVKPTTATGYYYEALDAGTSGGTEPTWPIFIGETVTDNDITWEAKGYTNDAGAWQASYAYVVGQQISVTIGGIAYLFGISVAGTSGGSAPDWSIETGQSTIDNEITWTCLGPFKDDAPPKYHKPSFAFMDGYLFLILKKADGSDSADIYNSDVDNPYSWNPINFIVAEQFPDNLQALARQNNMLVAFGDTSTEFFYDAGNASGTPLARNTSYTLQVGIAAPNAVYQNEKFCLFIGQSQSGGRAVWMLDGFVPKKVSDEYIDRIIDTLTHAQVMAVSGFGLRTNGHLFYIINLPSFSLVYDVEERMWWESTGGNFIQMTDDDSGKAIIQGATTGKIYYVDPTVGTDDGVPIQMEAYTMKYDFDTMNLKSMQSLNVVSDQVGTTTTMQIRWSDDDYRTWSDWRTLNFNPRAYFANLGSFRRRAFNLKYAGGLPARFESLEFDVRAWKA
jgi:hypothetical protein